MASLTHTIRQAPTRPQRGDGHYRRLASKAGAIGVDDEDDYGGDEVDEDDSGGDLLDEGADDPGEIWNRQ